jgi:TRAP-type C4-dicarboxylate transport system substrate-binding protein
MAELRKTILWIWNLDDALALQTSALGLRTVALSLDGGSRAYDDKSVDGFVAMPTAALAFQWSVQARYLQNLELAWRNGCVFIASRAFDPLPIEVQRYMRTATAKLRQRLDDMNMRQDDALIGGLFARQGMKTIPVSDQFRLEFFREAREQRVRLGDKLVPPKLLEQVLAWLADYRAEHSIAK